MSTYQYGEATYTEDDVIRRAQEKGLSIDEYLAQNPDVKKVEEGKTNGDVEDANATSETAASNQEVVQPQNNQKENTELESEGGSSGYNHITTEQLQDYTPLFAEKDTATKLEEIYGDNFTISEEAPGLDRIRMTSKSNPEQTQEFSLMQLGKTSDKGAIDLQTQISKFVEQTAPESIESMHGRLTQMNTDYNELEKNLNTSKESHDEYKKINDDLVNSLTEKRKQIDEIEKNNPEGFTTQAEVDEYNNLINSYNEVRSTYQSNLPKYESSIDEFNENLKLSQNSSNTYNSLYEKFKERTSPKKKPEVEKPKHITLDQLKETNKGMWSESNTAELLEGVYGDKFDVTEEAVGVSRIKLKNKSNGVEREFNIGEMSGEELHSQITGFVDITSVMPESEDGKRRKSIMELTGTIAPDDSIDFIDLNQSNFPRGDRERFFNRDGEIGSIDPVGSFMSGGYNPEQTQTDTQKLEDISSDISNLMQSSLYRRREGRENRGEFEIQPEEKDEILEEVFKSLNSSGDYLLSRDQFSKITGGSNKTFLENEIRKHAAEFEKDRIISNEFAAGLNKELKKQELDTIYKTLPKPWQEKADLVSQRSPLETQLKNLNHEIQNEENPEKLKELKILRNGVQSDINNIQGEIKKLGETSGYFWDYEKEDLTSAWAAEGYSQYRADRMAESFSQTKTDSDDLGILLQDIKNSNPTLTDREALDLHLNKLIIGKQRIIKDGKEHMVTVDLSKLGRDKKGVTKDFLNKIKQRGYWAENEQGEIGEVEMSVSELMSLGFDARDFRGWFDSWQTKGAMSKEDVAALDTYEADLDYNHGATRAVYELTHLDRDPGKIAASTGAFDNILADASQFTSTVIGKGTKAIATQWFDQSERQADQSLMNLRGGKEGTGAYTDRAMLDKMNIVASEFNEKNTADIEAGKINPLVWTDGQLKAIERTFADGVAEGVGEFVPTLIELAAITAVSEGALTVTGAGAYLQRLKKATDVWSKMKYHTAHLALEEIKMQTAGFKPGSGAAFYAGGALTPWFRPGALPMGVGKVFKGFDPLWNKTIKAGVVGAGSGEFAAITELGIEALEGEMDFNSEMKHLFGDFEEVEQRMLTNAFVFGIAGQMGKGRLKSTDLHVTTGAKYRLRNKIENKRKNLLYTKAEKKELQELDKLEKQNEKDRASGKISEKEYLLNRELIEWNKKTYDKPSREKKDLSGLELSRYEALERAEIEILQLATAQANAIELNPENKNFEANYQRIVVDPINAIMRQANKNHKDLAVEFVSDVQARSLFENDGSVAEYDRVNNSILFNKNRFKAGTSNHELVHMALRQVFNSRGERLEPNFKKRLDKVFKGHFNKDLHTYLTTEIKEKYTVGSESANAKLKERFDKGEISEKQYKEGLKENEKKRKQEEEQLQDEEFLSNLAEVVTNPEVYYTMINNSFLKNAKQEVKQFIEESVPGMGKHFKPETPKEFIEFLGRLGDSGRKGRKMGQKVLNLSKLDDISWLGIEYRDIVDGGKKMSAKNLSEQRTALVEANKALVSMKPELRPKNWRDITKKNSEKVKEINNNLRISEANNKNIRLFKERQPGDPTRTRAENALIKDNTPIIETWFKKNFKRGLDVSESEFRGSMYEQVAKIMNSYNDFNVPFGYYLKDRLGYQLGNIIRRAQAGRSTDIAMSEMRLSAEELQIADTSPELARSASGPDAPKGRELVKDLKIPEDVVAKAEERLGKLDVDGLTYKTLKDLVPEFTNELLGVEPKPGNLGKQSVANAQKWFSKDSNARLFIDLLPEGTIPMEGAPELVKGRSTGVQTTLLKEFYNKGGRAKTKAGAAVQTKISNITPRQVKDYFGIKPDGSFVELKNDRALSQKVKAAVDQIGKAWTNQVARESLRNNPQFEIRTSIENLLNQVQAGKSNKLSGKDIGGVYKLLEAGIINANTVIENLPAGKSRNLILGMVLGKESLTLNKDVILYNEKKNRELEGLTEKEANDISIQSEREILGVAKKNGLSLSHSSYTAISKNPKLVEWRKELDAEFYKEFGYSLEEINALTTHRSGQKNPGAISALLRELGFGNKARKQILENGEAVYLNQEGKTPAQAIHSFLGIKTKTGKGKDATWMEKVFSPNFAKLKKDLQKLENDMLNSDKNYTHKEIADAKIEMIRAKSSYSGKSKDYEATEAANARLAKEVTAAKLAVAMRNANSKYGLEWLLQDRGMQTNVTNGVTKSMIYNLRSINAIGSMEGKIEAPNAKGEIKIKDNKGISSHWEHALQLLNNTQFLLGIAKKHKSVTPEALKDIDRLIEASQQDLIPKNLQLFNDAKGPASFSKDFGKEGSVNLSNNALLNVFTNNALGRMSNQYIVSGPNKGRTIAEVQMEKYTNNQIKDILSKTSKKEWGEFEYNLDRKLKDVDLAKINIKNLQTMKLSSKGMSNSEIREVSTNIDKAVQLGRKKNKKPRGISVYDFDDTLARTKSGIRYTIPNPSGKPSPGRKAILLTGSAGAGKSTVIDGLGLRGQGFKVVNQDVALDWLTKNSGLPKNMNEFTREQTDKWRDLQYEAATAAKNKAMRLQGNGDGVVIDGTGASKIHMETRVREFRQAGYDVKIVHVDSSLENALARNKSRSERRLTDTTVKNSWEAVQANKKRFRELGVEVIEVNTDNLKQGSLPPEFVSKINEFVSGYTKGRLTAEQFALEGSKLLEQGAEYDFSEFNKVVEGTPGPLFPHAVKKAKKYGTKDMFVLTARPQESAGPIYQFLKSQGLEIPLENITGLANSAGEAKAQWMLEKFAEGYNDFYFVDDAPPNVKAVKKVLEQLDIKSNVQQALAAKDLSKGLNDILGHSLDIAPEKTFSKAEAKVRGADIKRRRVFMTDSAADLELLLEPLYGKGKEGIKNKEWFVENFIKPFERGYNDINNAKQKAANEYLALRKQDKDTVKSLDKEVGDTGFTNDMAIRVYNWNKNGIKIPDLAKATERKLVEHVRNNPELQAFAENTSRIVEVKEPSNSWWAETIASEVSGLGEGVSRKKHLAEWIEAKNEMFSEANLNKMESKLGSNWRRNVEEMFERMETGKTRRADLGTAGNAIMDYLNGSVGTIMNFNTRSATLQLLSTVNFINHDFNNPIAAGKAFANQPQYWKDFMTIMNSDMLKQRRAGLQINVTEAELAAAAAGSRNPARAVMAKILKAGYIPTKIADSFAIASGGATYYRNSIKKYMKEGMSKDAAEKQAWIDFQAMAERTQQSSRPDLLSAQQVSWGGRIILPFANTPMQMNRIMMKELLDIKNGRYNSGLVGENTLSNKISKIGYYGFVQSAIFAGLQSGLFALMAFSDDDKLKAEKETYAINTMADSFLRGMGIQGAVLATVKNALLEFQKQNNKGYGADFSEVAEKLLNVSPTIGSKFSKLDAAGNTYMYNKKEILEKGLTLDSPALTAVTMATEALFNAPTNRGERKIDNIKVALDEQNEWWQRVLAFGGWSKWDSGVGQREKAEEKAEKEAQKKIERENKKIEKKEKEEKKVRCIAQTPRGRCKNRTRNVNKKCYAHR